MKFTAEQIAILLNGKVKGNPNQEVFTVSKIEEGAQGSLSFLANPKYENYIYTTKASIIIVGNGFIPQKSTLPTLIYVDNPHGSFSKLLSLYNEVKSNKRGREQPIFISDTASIGVDEYIGAFAYIGENTKIGNNVKIYPQVYIGSNVEIGDNTTIYAGVKIYDDTKIGRSCKIHASSVIGSDGFGFTPNSEGVYESVPQIGNVIIEDNVDIGANTTVDRATLGSTIIKRGVKLDNLIQIGHNVEVGENTVIAAQSGIAGSSKVGDRCMIGGQVGIIGHLKLGSDLKIQAQSGVSKNLKDKEVVQGTPAYDYQSFSKSYVLFKNLPKINKLLNSIEKELKAQKHKND